MVKLRVRQHYSPVGWDKTYYQGAEVDLPDAEAEVLLDVAPERFELVEARKDAYSVPTAHFRPIPMMRQQR